MPVTITHYCPNCKTQIQEGPSWYIGISPLFVNCSNPECNQVLKISGAYEWDAMPCPLRVIYIIGHALGYFLLWAGGGALCGVLVTRITGTTEDLAVLIIGAIAGILGFVRWGFVLRQEIAQSRIRMADPAYRCLIEKNR